MGWHILVKVTVLVNCMLAALDVVAIRIVWLTGSIQHLDVGSRLWHDVQFCILAVLQAEVGTII